MSWVEYLRGVETFGAICTSALVFLLSLFALTDWLRSVFGWPSAKARVTYLESRVATLESEVQVARDHTKLAWQRLTEKDTP